MKTAPKLLLLVGMAIWIGGGLYLLTSPPELSSAYVQKARAVAESKTRDAIRKEVIRVYDDDIDAAIVYFRENRTEILKKIKEDQHQSRLNKKRSEFKKILGHEYNKDSEIDKMNWDSLFPDEHSNSIFDDHILLYPEIFGFENDIYTYLFQYKYKALDVSKFSELEDKIVRKYIKRHQKEIDGEISKWKRKAAAIYIMATVLLGIATLSLYKCGKTMRQYIHPTRQKRK